MKNYNKEIRNLIYKYGKDTRLALQENKKLPYLYALAELRENVLDWYEFKPDSSLLQVGADYGALTGLFLRRTGNVTVLDASEESLQLVEQRYRTEAGLKTVCGSLVSGKTLAADGYDYVTVIGTLCAETSLEEQLEAAKKALRPGGVLFVAVCNTFGIKYFAGSERDAVTASKKELQKLLPNGTFYYPVPDYRIASELYSDAYLPKKGDLTGVYTAYDYPQYTSMDTGAAYDAVCEDGQFDNFSNSFLVIWEKGV